MSWILLNVNLSISYWCKYGWKVQVKVLRVQSEHMVNAQKNGKVELSGTVLAVCGECPWLIILNTVSRFIILRKYLIPQFNCFALNHDNINFYHSFIKICMVYVCKKNPRYLKTCKIFFLSFYGILIPTNVALCKEIYGHRQAEWGHMNSLYTFTCILLQYFCLYF